MGSGLCRCILQRFRNSSSSLLAKSCHLIMHNEVRLRWTLADWTYVWLRQGERHRRTHARNRISLRWSAVSRHGTSLLSGNESGAPGVASSLGITPQSHMGKTWGVVSITPQPCLLPATAAWSPASEERLDGGAGVRRWTAARAWLQLGGRTTAETPPRNSKPSPETSDLMRLQRGGGQDEPRSSEVMVGIVTLAGMGSSASGCCEAPLGFLMLGCPCI